MDDSPESTPPNTPKSDSVDYTSESTPPNTPKNDSFVSTSESTPTNSPKRDAVDNTSESSTPPNTPKNDAIDNTGIQVLLIIFCIITIFPPPSHVYFKILLLSANHNKKHKIFLTISRSN